VNKFLLYFHTIRHLKLIQVVFRLYYKVFKPRKTGSEIIDFDNIRFPELTILEFAAPSLFKENKVCFLNKGGSVDNSTDWNSSEKDKLWLYNLHYFDDLNSKLSKDSFELQVYWVKKWILENPLVEEGNGWEAYPISLRIVNWIKWLGKHNYHDESILTSLYEQACVLRSRLEYHILGNHLFANAKALIFAGVVFNNSKNDFLKVGISILEKELDEQFLEDGGHFELTPMYHSIMLNDLLDIFQLKKHFSHQMSRKIELIIVKAFAWLSSMTHQDEEIAFFNDATFGIAPRYIELEEYAKCLGLNHFDKPNSKLNYLSNSGYISFKDERHSLIFDVGDVGPDYLPGHAHADTLSLEWSIRGRRVFVNSGISEYGVSDLRQFQRSSKSHNCLVIDGEDSSEVWGGFRVARRAKVDNVSCAESASGFTLKARHDGYSRIYKGLLHSREVTLEGNKLIVTDSLTKKPNKTFVMFYLHPDVSAELLDSHRVKILSGNSEIELSSSGFVSILPSKWFPGFGKDIESRVLKVDFQDTRCITEVSF